MEPEAAGPSGELQAFAEETMNGPLISVIIPVYKAEHYLRRCVNSVRNQTYKNLEIILVDDGSPDRCPEMCDEFAGSDSRIRVIHKENSGVSAARNVGINAAAGDYIGFVDSDDFIMPEMYAVLYRHLVEYDAQIARCSIRIVNKDGSFRSYLDAGQGKLRTLSGREALRWTVEKEKVGTFCFDKLIARDIVKSTSFREGMRYEDFEFTNTCVMKAEKIVIGEEALYCYRMTGNNFSHSSSLSQFDKVTCGERGIAFYREHCPESLWAMQVKYIIMLLNTLMVTYGVKEFEEPRKKTAGTLKAFLREHKEMLQEVRVRLLLSKGQKIRLAAFFFGLPVYDFVIACKNMLDRFIRRSGL